MVRAIIFSGLWLAFLTGCASPEPVADNEIAGTVTAVLPTPANTTTTVPMATATAVALLPSAYPPPMPTVTSPYPGPLPYTLPTAVRFTPTPTFAINEINECASHPGLQRCGGIPLSGKLAYIQPDGYFTVINLLTETSWQSSQQNVRDVTWEQTGRILLVHNENQHTFRYQADGFLFDYYDRPLFTQPSGYGLRSGSLLWSADGTMAASIVTLEAKVAESGHSQWDHQVKIDFYDGFGQKQWSLEELNLRYDLITLLEWVTETDWLLIGASHGMIASQIATEYQLWALHTRTGELIDSGLSIPRDGHLTWHPSVAGLLATTDLRHSDVGGMGQLVLWQILENEIRYPAPSLEFVQNPVWSPNGRFLAFTVHDLSASEWLAILDTETGEVNRLTEFGFYPEWSADGEMIIYLEIMPNQPTAWVRAIHHTGGNSVMIAESRLPYCPGLCQSQTSFDYLP